MPYKKKTNKRTYKKSNKRTYKKTNKRTYKKTNKRTYKKTNKRSYKKTNKRSYKKTNPYFKHDVNLVIKPDVNPVIKHDVKPDVYRDLNTYFELHKEEGDGNCLFRALSRQTFGSPEFYMNVREEICDYLNTHPYLVEPDKDPETYITNMRKDKTWGGEPEIIAYSNMLKRPIKIYTEPHTNDISYYTKTFSFLNPIYLLHKGGNHYDSLLRREHISDEQVPLTTSRT